VNTAKATAIILFSDRGESVIAFSMNTYLDIIAGDLSPMNNILHLTVRLPSVDGFAFESYVIEITLSNGHLFLSHPRLSLPFSFRWNPQSRALRDPLRPCTRRRQLLQRPFRFPRNHIEFLDLPFLAEPRDHPPLQHDLLRD
jgi:hypothetical protein